MRRSLITHSIPLVDGLIHRIYAYVSFTAERFGERFGSEEGIAQFGGCWCLMNSGGELVMVGFAGKPDPLKRIDYHTNAQNKCRGMYQRREEPYCFSSWTFRDHNAPVPYYGGGIVLFNGYFMSFSGFPESVDEAYCIALAKKFRLLSSDLEREILAISKNHKLASQAFEFLKRIN